MTTPVTNKLSAMLKLGQRPFVIHLPQNPISHGPFKLARHLRLIPHTQAIIEIAKDTCEDATKGRRKEP